MKLFLSMFLSSNILFTLFVIIRHLKKDLLSPRRQYLILKIALFLAIIPFACLKSLLPLLTSQKKPFQSADGSLDVIMITPTEFHPTPSFKRTLIFAIVWGSIMMFVFIRCIWQYMKCRRHLFSTLQEITSPDILDVLEKQQKNLHLKKKIHIYKSPLKIPPSTIGILYPIIIIPDHLETGTEELVILHELCHIKYHDGLIRFLRLFMLGIYWFNPFVYLWNSYLESACELSCDEHVTQNMTLQQRQKYSHLIVGMAACDYDNPPLYSTHFSNYEIHIKERIYFIMRKRKTTSLLVTLLTLGMTLCSSIPILAYQEATVIYIENSTGKNVFLEDSNDTVWIIEQPASDNLLADPWPIIYDEQFVDSNGAIYPIKESAEKASCQHSYVDGIYQKHRPTGNGGCTVITYSCQRCSRCQAVEMGAYISAIDYATCPH